MTQTEILTADNTTGRSLRIVSFDDPAVRESSVSRLYEFTHRADADVTPFSIPFATLNPIGFVALLTKPNRFLGRKTEVVGYAGYTKVREFEGRGYPQVGGVALLPEFHGRGLGKALVTATVETMQSYGIEEMVAVCNGNSAPIFRSLGFEPIANVVSDRGREKPLYMLQGGQSGITGVE